VSPQRKSWGDDRGAFIDHYRPQGWMVRHGAGVMAVRLGPAGVVCWRLASWPVPARRYYPCNLTARVRQWMTVLHSVPEVREWQGAAVQGAIMTLECLLNEDAPPRRHVSDGETALG
jgi:hypothetical protein